MVWRSCLNSFASLGLSAEIVSALEDQGYQTPTPIQAAAIPKVLAGHDLLAAAQFALCNNDDFISTNLFIKTKSNVYNPILKFVENSKKTTLIEGNLRSSLNLSKLNQVQDKNLSSNNLVSINLSSSIAFFKVSFEVKKKRPLITVASLAFIDKEFESFSNCSN